LNVDNIRHSTYSRLHSITFSYPVVVHVFNKLYDEISKLRYIF